MKTWAAASVAEPMVVTAMVLPASSFTSLTPLAPYSEKVMTLCEAAIITSGAPARLTDTSSLPPVVPNCSSPDCIAGGMAVPPTRVTSASMPYFCHDFWSAPTYSTPSLPVSCENPTLTACNPLAAGLAAAAPLAAALGLAATEAGALAGLDSANAALGLAAAETGAAAEEDAAGAAPPQPASSTTAAPAAVKRRKVSMAHLLARGLDRAALYTS